MVCEACCISEYEFAGITMDLKGLWEWLSEHGVVKNQVACGNCGQPAKVNLKCLRFVCRKVQRLQIDGEEVVKKCRFGPSARVGTVLGQSRAPVVQIARFLSRWIKTRYPKGEMLAETTGFSRETITNWSSYCREICVNWLHDNRRQLGGHNVFVEIDETKCGKRKSHTGREVKGQWVFGMYERGSKKIVVLSVRDRSAATLIPIIKQWILPGTSVISDCWKAYHSLGSEGYTHYRVNHSKNFVAPENPSIHTQNIERLWLNLKLFLPRFGRRTEHFDGYIAEFLFRREYGHSALLHQFFAEAGKLYPPREF